MLIDNYLTAQQIMEQTGLSAAELLALPHDEYARLSGRPTSSQTALAALGYEPVPGTPRQEAPVPVPTHAPEPQGIDIALMSWEQYAAVRDQLGVQGREYGRGALDGGSTADWVAAARAKSGRAAMNEHNVQRAPQVDGSKYLDNGGQQVTGRQSWYRGA
jgi:hypothetical protein